MKNSLSLYSRRSIRLAGYDYSSAAIYFVTICSDRFRWIFGRVKGDKCILSPLGHMVEREWINTPKHHANMRLDLFVIMPNHVHFLLILLGSAQAKVSPLGKIIKAFKGVVTSLAHKQLGLIGDIWQSDFYERIVKSEQTLLKVREYIVNNPAKWQEDRYFTEPGKLWTPPGRAVSSETAAAPRRLTRGNSSNS